MNEKMAIIHTTQKDYDRVANIGKVKCKNYGEVEDSGKCKCYKYEPVTNSSTKSEDKK